MDNTIIVGLVWKQTSAKIHFLGPTKIFCLFPIFSFACHFPSLNLQSCLPRGAAPLGRRRNGWSGRLGHLAGSSAPAQPETELVISHMFASVLWVHSPQRPRGHVAKTVQVLGNGIQNFFFPKS